LHVSSFSVSHASSYSPTLLHISSLFFFFLNHTTTTQIYTLSLHDALPISSSVTATAKVDTQAPNVSLTAPTELIGAGDQYYDGADRKSTRLNSSHVAISYAVFCLKKKKKVNIELLCDYCRVVWLIS